MDWLELDARRFFLLGMRACFGAWLLYVGLTKWIAFGPTAFVGMITSQFDPTWSPHGLNLVLAWVILVAEPLLALLILGGRWTRMVWTATAGLMFMLTLGQTILMNPDVVGNWQYLVLTLICAALAEPDRRS